MKKALSFILISLLISSCCKDYNEDYSITNKTSSEFSIVVQTKDLNNVYKNVRINTIEWLGVDYVQQVNYDTAMGLTMNVKSNQTQFKINHDLGTDTITYTHNWEPVVFRKGCYANSSTFTRNYKVISYTATKATSINTPYFIVLKLN